MQTIKVKQGQTLFDSVIESTGDITNAFDIALKNQISVTDSLFNQLDLEVTGNENKAITKLFVNNKPASSDKESYLINDYLFTQTLQFIL